MTKREALSAALKVVGLANLISVVVRAPSVISAVVIGSALGGRFAVGTSAEMVLAIASLALGCVLALLMVLFGDALARWMVKEDGGIHLDLGAQFQTSAAEIYVKLLGLLLVVQGVQSALQPPSMPQAAAWAASGYLARHVAYAAASLIIGPVLIAATGWVLRLLRLSKADPRIP